MLVNGPEVHALRFSGFEDVFRPLLAERDTDGVKEVGQASACPWSTAEGELEGEDRRDACPTM